MIQEPCTDVALACAALLGIPTARVGQGFLCILPGHEEAHASASLHWDPKTGALQYHDWHARSGVERSMKAFSSCWAVSGGTRPRRRPHLPGALPPRGAGWGSGMSGRRCTGYWLMA
jgi:hypothetical protein